MIVAECWAATLNILVDVESISVDVQLHMISVASWPDAKRGAISTGHLPMTRKRMDIYVFKSNDPRHSTPQSQYWLFF
jgi:hypothetical protein